MKAVATLEESSGAWTRERGRARWTPDLLSLAILTLLSGFFASDLGHVSRLRFSTDTPNFFIPWYSYLGERLRDGAIPGWLPSVFSGAPFAGDIESGWLYVPAMVLFSLFPALTALKLFNVLHLVLAGFSAYTFCRLLRLGQLGALTGALAFEFGPFLRYTSSCNLCMQTAAWVPLSLIGIELAVRASSRLSQAGGWLVAGFALSQELGSWLGQGAYYGFLAAAAYLVFRTVLAPPLPQLSLWARLRALVFHSSGAFGFALGLAAAGVLPRLDAVSRSTRAGGNTPGGHYANAPPELVITKLLKVDASSSNYVGCVIIALAIIAPLIWSRNSTVIYFSGYSLVTAVLAMNVTPLHRLFFLLPRFETLHEHAPTRIQIVLWIGPAVLAGFTADAIAKASTRSMSLFRAVIVAVGAFELAYYYFERVHVVFPTATIITLALTTILLLLAAALMTSHATALACSPLGCRVALVCLLGLSLFDTTHRFYFARNTEVQQAVALAADSSPEKGAGAFLQARQSKESPFRFFGYDLGYYSRLTGSQPVYRYSYWNPNIRSLLVTNRSIVLGLEDVQGYDPVQVLRYSELIDGINGFPLNYHEANVAASGFDSPLLNMLNVRYVVVPVDVPAGRPDLLHLSQRYRTVYADGRVRVLENDKALPRAWIVHDVRKVNYGEAIPLLASGQVDPLKTALVEDVPPLTGEAVDGQAESVKVEQTSGDTVRLDVTATAPGMVVLSETYDPGWKAFVDGQQAPVFVADHALRAVPIEAGEHAIELRYEPHSLRLGILISAVFTFLAFAIAFALGLRALRVRSVRSVI
jgi:Bacterial membrane protein YfhO